MKSTTNSIKNDLWRSAVPLKLARTLFAPTALAESFKNTSEVHLLGEMAKQGSYFAGNQMSGIEAIVKSMGAALPAYKEKWDTIHALNKYFMDEFRSGNLRCFAFEAPRTLASVSVEILPGFWKAPPDWDKGEYKVDSLHFIEIRVLQRSSAEQLVYELELAVKGRPTISHYVEAAFNDLQTNGRIETKSSARSHFPMVRAWIANNFKHASIDAGKLSDEGIRRHFSPLFKELKKTTKQ